MTSNDLGLQRRLALIKDDYVRIPSAVTQSDFEELFILMEEEDPSELNFLRDIFSRAVGILGKGSNELDYHQRFLKKSNFNSHFWNSLKEIYSILESEFKDFFNIYFSDFNFNSKIVYSGRIVITGINSEGFQPHLDNTLLTYHNYDSNRNPQSGLYFLNDDGEKEYVQYEPDCGILIPGSQMRDLDNSLPEIRKHGSENIGNLEKRVSMVTFARLRTRKN